MSDIDLRERLKDGNLERRVSRSRDRGLPTLARRVRAKHGSSSGNSDEPGYFNAQCEPLVAQVLGTGPSPRPVAGRFDFWTIWQDGTTKVVTSKAALFKKV
jgi:hypothetical protein